MEKSNDKQSKGASCVRISLTVMLFSFLGLCISVIFLSSTLQMSFVSDMPVPIKGITSSNVTVGTYSAPFTDYTGRPGNQTEDIFGNRPKSNNSGRRSNCSSCFQHNFNYVIQNEKICKLYSAVQTIDLFLFIMTTHNNTKERAALRSTWLSHTKNNTANVRYAFLLGEISDNKRREAVMKENKVYHDILKEDFVDTYSNLTYKTIMGFKWAAIKCAHAHYVMKTDDDMFINIPNVLNLFKGRNIETLQKAVFGRCEQKAGPIRDKKSKWFASVKSYPEKFYPGFCSGTGYVTSMHVAKAVYEISSSIPFFHLEDVYVSLCIKQLGFKLQSKPGFNMVRPKLDPCLYKGKGLITAHHLTPAMLQSIWNKQCVKK